VGIGADPLGCSLSKVADMLVASCWGNDYCVRTIHHPQGHKAKKAFDLDEAKEIHQYQYQTILTHNLAQSNSFPYNR
jgi:hypothetical protein